MTRRLGCTLCALLAAGIVAALISGCGASAAIDPVAKAADATASVPGYRMSAVMQIGTSAGSTQMTLSGVFDRASKSGSMSGQETIGGRRLQFDEVFSGLLFYIKASGLPGVSRLAGGKPWLKLDMSKMLGAMGIGGLPTSGSDPSQFVDFLRAVSSSTKKVGTATIRGVATTHYRASVDLDKYPAILPAARRAAAQHTVKTLELALGSHTLPMDAWIDHGNLVRRLAFGFTECVSNQRIELAMTMDLYDYGNQTEPQIPSSTDAYDISPLIASSMSKITYGCNASA